MDQLQYREERYEARRGELRKLGFLTRRPVGAWLHGMRQAATAERTGTCGDNCCRQGAKTSTAPLLQALLDRLAIDAYVVQLAASRGPRGQVAAVPRSSAPRSSP